MANIRQFEDDVIRWLLSRYRLLDTRTRWMLLDIEEQLFAEHDADDLPMGEHPRPRMLSFRAFHEFFPEFPVRLNSAVLTSGDCMRLKFPRTFVGFEKTRLCREFRYACEMYTHPALVYRWPYQRETPNSIVLHDCLPPTTSRPGCHCCWCTEDGKVVVMQALPSFVDSVESLVPFKTWKASAADPQFCEVV